MEVNALMCELELEMFRYGRGLERGLEIRGSVKGGLLGNRVTRAQAASARLLRLFLHCLLRPHELKALLLWGEVMEGGVSQRADEKDAHPASLFKIVLKMWGVLSSMCGAGLS